MDFSFSEPVISLLAQDGLRKDSLLTKEFINRGEYLKLNNTFFLFKDISNDGRYITLIKEKHFEEKIGTQVDMIIPDFVIKLTNGKILKSSDKRKKLLLFANISGCNPDSYEMFRKLTSKDQNGIDIIGIEYGQSNNFGVPMVDTRDSFNNDFYLKYRNEWSSYDCFLINENGRLIDEFEIFEWESVLLNYFHK